MRAGRDRRLRGPPGRLRQPVRAEPRVQARPRISPTSTGAQRRLRRATHWTRAGTARCPSGHRWYGRGRRATRDARRYSEVGPVGATSCFRPPGAFRAPGRGARLNRTGRDWGERVDRPSVSMPAPRGRGDLDLFDVRCGRGRPPARPRDRGPQGRGGPGALHRGVARAVREPGRRGALETGYTLEVTQPGVDAPLTDRRAFERLEGAPCSSTAPPTGAGAAARHGRGGRGRRRGPRRRRRPPARAVRRDRQGHPDPAW